MGTRLICFLFFISQGQINVPNGLKSEDTTSFPSALGAEIQTLVIGLNLYMVSQNCHVSKSLDPLVRKPSGTANHLSMLSVAVGFHGVIYANGTVDENPPPDFHLDQVDDCRDPSK